jgi:hypothetical protein
MANKKSDPSEVINIPDLRHIYIPNRVTVVPKTPGWTDRSRNGVGFHEVFRPEELHIDPNGTGDTKKYRRH